MGETVLLLSAAEQGRSIPVLRPHVDCHTVHLISDTDELGVFKTVGNVA